MIEKCRSEGSILKDFGLAVDFEISGSQGTPYANSLGYYF